MKAEMNISYDFNLIQEQNVSLNTIQLMKLLQMNVVELSKFIDEELLENPALEAEHIASASFYSSDWRVSFRKNNNAVDYNDPAILFSVWEDKVSLYDDICRQIQDASVPFKTIALSIASCIDSNGFISQEDMDCVSANYGSALADKALEFVQSLSPAGLAARSASERLLLQLKRKNASPLALEIAQTYIDDLSFHRYSNISKCTGESINQVSLAVKEILALDPFPFSEYEISSPSQYIVPDIVLDDTGNLSIAEEWTPKLNINPFYARMLSESDDPEVKQYLSEKLKNAKWLINSLSQRREMLLRCTRAIISNQKTFFDSMGKSTLRPLTQRDVAAQLNVSASTICRTVNSKYLRCPFGTFPLSAFFCSSVHADLGDTSSAQIKRRIGELINAESRIKPLSDQKIVDALSQEAITVSRRTIAKYRMELGVPGTSVRKELYKFSEVPFTLKE